jgi:thermostable 8-oxoguanine DNA glycosylase
MSRYLIDPHKITNFNRTNRELQTFYMFCVLVAGKNSAIQARKLDAFLSEAPYNMLPFSYINKLWYDNQLMDKMMEHKLGQYKRLFKCFTETFRSVECLRRTSVFALERVFGVGPKTARFFLTHSRETAQNFAVLDTHVLRWMRDELGVDAPKATPNGTRYSELEQTFLRYCRKVGATPAELDLHIWSKYNKGVKT